MQHLIEILGQVVGVFGLSQILFHHHQNFQHSQATKKPTKNVGSFFVIDLTLGYIF